jgi:CHRD domain-containing protein
MKLRSLALVAAVSAALAIVIPSVAVTASPQPASRSLGGLTPAAGDVAPTATTPASATQPPRREDFERPRRLRPLFAALNGGNEIAPDGTRGAGDRNGAGSFSAVIDGRELCYGLAVRDIQDPVAAHIHRGGRDTNGPIVVPLTAPDSGNPGVSSDCTRLRRSLVRAIRRNPGRYYVNVHTGDFPDGAVRGQLFSRGGP